MASGTIAIIILFVILLAGGGVVYYFYERPAQVTNQINYTDLSISAVDENDNNIIIGYDIFLDKTFLKSGETLEQSAILDKVSQNVTYSVYSRNLEDQEYYIYDVRKFSGFSPVQRIILRPIPIGNLSIVKKNNLGGDQININLTSDGTVKFIHYCVEWSTRIARVLPPEGLTEVPPPKRYENKVDKCYFTNQTLLDGENMSISLNYSIFGNVDERDFIRLILIDADRKPFSEQLIMSSDGEDAWLEDIEILIKKE